jgi:MinD-like ATPase involved in chromosome partitioning or flagellar assembly
MKKIITALGNNRLNQELRRYGKYEIVSQDVSYREGILEILEEIPNVDTIIVSEILEGNISFESLISEILQIKENIEIIVFVEEKTEEIQNFLFRNGIYKIYSNNEIELEKFIESLQEKTEDDDRVERLNQELDEMRKIIHSKGNLDTWNLEARGEVIAIIGAYNSGKSTIACTCGKEYASQGKKTLIIDFDIYNSSINVLLDVQKYNNKGTAFDIQDQIIHISKNEDILCAMDLLFSNNNTVDYINLENMLQEFRILYDVIIIDTTSDYKYKYLPRILNDADKIIFLSVPSIVELKKSIQFIEVIKKDLKIDKDKIQIVLNKSNNYSIDEKIITNVLQVGNLLGTIKYDEQIEVNIKNKKQNTNINAIVGG